MKRAAVVVLLLALAGCGGDGTAPPAAAPSLDATPTLTASPTPQAGPARFLVDARTLPFGKADLRKASDDQLLDTGQAVCSTMTIGNYSQVVRELGKTDYRPTTAEAERFTQLAVQNLCPEHEGKLP